MIDLKKYVGRTVMLHMKQPYQLQMARLDRGTPVPLALVFEEGQPPQLATEKSDPERVQKVTTDVLVATIVERSGGFVAQLKDPTSNGKIEIEVMGDMLMAVTAACEDRILIA